MLDCKSDDDDDDGCFAEKFAKAKEQANAKRAKALDDDDDDEVSDDEVQVLEDSQPSTNSTVDLNTKEPNVALATR